MKLAKCPAALQRGIVNFKEFLYSAKVLETDLKALGLWDVCLDKNCYLTATLPSNHTEKYPIIGLLAHMDIFPDMRGENACPKIIYNNIRK